MLNCIIEKYSKDTKTKQLNKTNIISIAVEELAKLEQCDEVKKNYSNIISQENFMNYRVISIEGTKRICHSRYNS
jgi:hypothetical protein